MAKEFEGQQSGKVCRHYKSEKAEAIEFKGDRIANNIERKGRGYRSQYINKKNCAITVITFFAVPLICLSMSGMYSKCCKSTVGRIIN